MSSLLFGPTDGQIEQLQEQFPHATEQKLPDGSAVVMIPSFPLASGWSQTATATCFIVPVGYPIAKPDCFYADRSLRLASGALPRNAREQPVPQLDGETWLWFSWHLVTWHVTRDSYLTFARVMEKRFAETA